MNHSTTIIFAYRNRDVVRVNLALQSLQTQTNKNFQVLLIDYGSDIEYASKLIAVVKAFDFANYVYVGHTGLLWNKSKALNYGIRNATTDYIITADIDVLFTPNFIEKAHQLANLNQFSLFKIGYLSKQISEQQHRLPNLKHIKTTHVGDTFGIGLYPKIVLEKVRGLDEFFHFYGSEDEDLNMRVQLTGANLFRCEEVMLYHQWHPRYPQKM
jgi:glycosyltransferase involved in cell wall biosynthesis